MKLHINKFLALFSIICLLLISPSFGSEIPKQIEYQGNKLNLNGQGTRIIFFMKVYEGSLYLESKSSNAEEIVNMNDPMAIRIDVTSAMVTADAMKKALSEGLEKSTSNNTDPISNEIISYHLRSIQMFLLETSMSLYIFLKKERMYSKILNS